jgi:glutathione S-transferase
MKLLYTPFDYVHAVEAVINYSECHDQIEPIPTDPFAENPDALTQNNPLGTVPTLITDAGVPLFGGPVVYEFLDSLHDKPRLFPRNAEQCLIARRRLWLADAIFDAAVRLVIEGWQPVGAIRPDYAERTWGKVERGLDAFEEEVSTFATLDIGQLRLVTSINYLDTKLPSPFNSVIARIGERYDWRTERPTLSTWHAKSAKDAIFTSFLDPALSRGTT